MSSSELLLANSPKCGVSSTDLYMGVSLSMSSDGSWIGIVRWRIGEEGRELLLLVGELILLFVSPVEIVGDVVGNLS